jgi:NAD(P)-dependent dehydrogenase (short-subunit alcohol dehydrogenase family)
VTGGASGIGLGIAKALLGAGMNVVIADIRDDHLESAKSELGSEQRVLALQLDVTDRGAYARAADAAEARFHKIHLLCNNAGIAVIGPTELATFDDWDWVMGVNLHGPINGVLTFAPRMIAAAKGGYIVNTASMAAFLAAGMPGIYNTTKFAVRGLSQSLRASLAPHGIGVSVLCPGLVKSYIYASADIRPEELKGGARPVDADGVKRLADIHEFGMEPDVIAGRVLEAMREDRFHIFSHPEFKDELREVFDEVLADFRDYPVDPGYEKRTEFEKMRRDSYRKQRKGLKAS